MLSSLTLIPQSPLPPFAPRRLPFRPSPSTLPSQRRRSRSPATACGGSDSWFPVDPGDDGCGGWTEGSPGTGGKKGVPRLVVSGVGSSVVVLLAVAVHFSLARKKGFKIQLVSPFQLLSEIFRTPEPTKSLSKETELRATESTETEVPSKPVSFHDESESPRSKGEKKYDSVPVTIDSTQQEAVSLLQKLKIIESDVKPQELCTRREFARWLVKANFILERNSKHKIVPSMLPSGSTVNAFDDVCDDDPDFLFIQAIGEAGVIPSRFSVTNCGKLDDGDSRPVEKYMFSPESFLTRIDLISWKAKLEYPHLPGMDEKMLRKNLGFMDLGAVNSDALQDLVMDILAGERSITRRVFGNIRRLQPLKPVTKAQVAVAITSGRMQDALRVEIARLEADHVTRMVEMKEIRDELNLKGDIWRYWAEKFEEEKTRGLQVKQDLLQASEELVEEKLAYQKQITDHVKEKAALDCQWQLLLNLKEEIDAMNERLANAKTTTAAEQQSLEEFSTALCEKQNAILEAKSVMEAEKEALRILRSWVEDGARQSQFRAKILEDAVQRWKWDDQTKQSGPSEEV